MSRLQALPPCLEYIPIPGEWERKDYPNWPDDRFRIPDTKNHEGEVYYIRKGYFVGIGTTALVERLPSGGSIVKTPLLNPVNPIEERMNREGMAREAEVYRSLMRDGGNSATPRLLDWDPQSCTLTLEYHCNGDLATYIKESTNAIDLTIRGKWATQAARALSHLHSHRIVHADVAPRNFLLNDNLDLCICDFAGSSFPGSSVPTSAPGSRYQARPWGQGYVPSEADDVFGLGSVIYFIMAGEEAYHDMDNEEVERRLRAREFPDTKSLRYGSVIRGCWDGQLVAASAVEQALDSCRVQVSL